VALGDCDPSPTPILTPGDVVWCGFSIAHSATPGVYTDVVSASATFNQTAANADEDSNVVTVTIVDNPPAALTGLSAVGEFSNVALDWADSPEGDVTGYNVYRSTTTPVAVDVGHRIASGVATSSYDDASAVDGTVYFYLVTAVDASSESSPSGEVIAYPGIIRINAGGATVAATDAGPAWLQDTTAANHPFLADSGSNNNSGGSANTFDGSVPGYVPAGVWTGERWSSSGFSYDIPVPSGTWVVVNVLAANSYSGTSTGGTRVFDLDVEGTLESGIDLSGTYGHQTGHMFTFTVQSDGVVDINFIFTGPENPLANAIEVYTTTPPP
jgi:hypothetical protein